MRNIVVSLTFSVRKKQNATTSKRIYMIIMIRSMIPNKSTYNGIKNLN